MVFKEPSPIIERLLSVPAFRQEVMSKAQQSAHLAHSGFEVPSVDAPNERRRLRRPLQFQHGLSVLLRPTHFPRQQRRNGAPAVSTKIGGAGHVGLRGRHREEESESSIELLSYEAELPERRRRAARFESLYSRFRGPYCPGKLASRHEHAFPRPPKSGPVDRHIRHGFPPQLSRPLLRSSVWARQGTPGPLILIAAADASERPLDTHERPLGRYDRLLGRQLASLDLPCSRRRHAPLHR